LKNGCIHRKYLPLETSRGGHLEVEFFGNVYSVGQTRKIQCTIRDKSLLNQDEKVEAEGDAQLRKVEKMTSIATLSSVVAYQFNNALAVVKLALGVMKSEKMIIKADPNVLLINNAVEKMSRMSSELLSYTRSGEYRIETVCITEIVTACFSVIKPVLKSSITLEAELPSDLPKIRADKLQVQKALLAIVQNSIEAIETHGRIQVVCRQHVMTPDKIISFPGLSPGIYVGLTVRDTGKGMDEETRARVFEPFLSARFSGRGLGMAEVYGMVKNHKGWISVESQPNQGTEVSIYFPAMDWVECLTTGKNSWAGHH
jgi:signal transduction histidine kinase